MRKINIILLCILVLGLYLRWYHYLEFPRKGATFDEYAWTWLGMNIIQRGVPLSWSPHPQYEFRSHYIEQGGASFWLVQPYLEHPPLFGLIVGEYALLHGVKDMYSFELRYVRSLALILGVASILLVYSLAKEVIDDHTALIASALYATAPTVVIGSRLVQNENFFIPVFLFATWLTVKYLKTSNTRFLTLSVICCGLITLAKVPWFAAGGTQILLLFANKRWREGVVFGVLVCLFFSLFFLWGWRWNWTVFINLWKLQMSRYDITFDGIFSLFTSPYLVDRFFIDGWIYVGWFSYFMLCNRFPKYLGIIFPLLAYFCVYIFAIPNEPSHGWYRYPFYPFLFISLAITIKESVGKRSLFPFMSSIFIGASLLQSSWGNTFGFSYVVYRGFLVLIGFLLLPMLYAHLRNLGVFKLYYACVFAVLIFLNIWSVIVYVE